MGVRSRTIALVGATSVLLWLALGAAAALYADRTSNETDTRTAVGVLESSSAAVASELERLVAICGDWAAWDDTHQFVQNRDSDYIDANLADETLANLGIDFMVFTDASGRILHAKAIDPTTRHDVAAPEGLKQYLESRPALLFASDPKTATSGAISLPEGPYLIATQPISRSDYSAAAGGTFITGYRVGAKALSKIERLTLHPISIFASTSPSLPADVQSAASQLDKPTARVTNASDDTTLMAYAAVPGVEDRPGLILRAAVPRSAHLEARRNVVGVGLAITLFGTVVFGVLGITLDITVLRRLVGLSSAVRRVGRSSDSEARVPESGSDEIRDLATEINRMLDELGRSQAEMAYLVEHDPLTGLFNRRRFENELQREIDEHLRLGDQGAVLWFDLDHFKDINDSLGHAAGDELLSAFGRHLQSETRSYCTVARLGGDEFGMLIPHSEGPDAFAAASRLIEGFSERTFLAGNRDLRVSASAGVVLYPEHGSQTSDLLARADIAMYDAKARGGNQVVAYSKDDAWQSDMTERLNAAERILSAMREDRLLLYAQPIRSCVGDGTQSFELLLRMRDEDGSLVLPADIIPTAERLGLIRDIDRWVARRAIRLLSLTREEDLDIEFSINLSGCAFSDTALLDVIRDEFEITGASPERLIIEITETTTIANIEEARNFILALKEIGCRFAIDDFGSGTSSYYYLKHLPVDFLKIDGSLVKGLTTDSADVHFVNAIIEMCRGLDIQTVAEYVETERILAAVNNTGVDFIQGYHVGMPEPLDTYLGSRFAESVHAWLAPT